MKPEEENYLDWRRYNLIIKPQNLQITVLTDIRAPQYLFSRSVPSAVVVIICWLCFVSRAEMQLHNLLMLILIQPADVHYRHFSLLFKDFKSLPIPDYIIGFQISATSLWLQISFS